SVCNPLQDSTLGGPEVGSDAASVHECLVNDHPPINDEEDPPRSVPLRTPVCLTREGEDRDVEAGGLAGSRWKGNDARPGPFADLGNQSLLPGKRIAVRPVDGVEELAKARSVEGTHASSV